MRSPPTAKAVGDALTRLLFDHLAPVLALMVVVLVTISFWHINSLQDELVESVARQGASLHAEVLEELRSKYTADVVERVRGHGTEITHDYAGKPNAIPLPATLTIELSEKLGQRGSGISARLYSEYPFPWRQNGGPRDAYEQAALQELRRNPEQPYVRTEQYNGGPALRYAVADRMRSQCVACHNTHPQSPKRDWKEGEVRGVLEIIRPLTPVVNQARRGLHTSLVLVTIFAFAGISAVALVVGKQRRDATELRDRAAALARANDELSQEIAVRTRVEAALRQAQDELEMRVQERTAELRQTNENLANEIDERRRAEAELALRSQELVRSNTELEQLAYVASHDLQEPLRMVASYLQLLERRYQGKLDSNANEFIGFAVDGAKRMQVLINDLLAYSRVGSRIKPFQPVDCNAVFDTVMSNLRVAVADANATVTRDRLPTVMADSTQLNQLFQNLIANALKFRGEQPPEVHVGVREEGAFWRFSVRDNGIGIASDYYERIFVLFQRLHARSAYPGTGIGLAICKKIVELHGGRIWVESQPGAGTTFFFTLPQKGSES